VRPRYPASLARTGRYRITAGWQLIYLRLLINRLPAYYYYYYWNSHCEYPEEQGVRSNLMLRSNCTSVGLVVCGELVASVARAIVADQLPE